MHVHAHACIHTCIWRPEDDSQRLPQLLTTLCIEVDLSQNPELAISASPPNRFVQAISCFCQIDIQIKWIYRWSVMSTWLLHGFWGSGVWSSWLHTENFTHWAIPILTFAFNPGELSASIPMGLVCLWTAVHRSTGGGLFFTCTLLFADTPASHITHNHRRLPGGGLGSDVNRTQDATDPCPPRAFGFTKELIPTPGGTF